LRSASRQILTAAFAESVSPLASKIGRSTTLAIARRRPAVPMIATARARSISPSSSSLAR
jgi:hypothetical protein